MAARKRRKSKRRSNPQMSEKLFERIADFQEKLDRVLTYGQRLESYLERGTKIYAAVENFNAHADKAIEEIDEAMDDEE